ncbi:unnamed protein product [Orchesella dallaii]|uniref:Uncharacterized protein n=1 Tax=Orchesella dallaii TaxID=48710 RepID=A0ABP1RW83_9HEXA
MEIISLLVQDANNKSEGEIAESSLLFDILETRNGSFNALIEALKATKQAGSLEILQGARADGKHLCLNAEDITDSTNWDEFSDTLKSLMCNKLVLFQRTTLKLHELLSHYKQVSIDGKLLQSWQNTIIPQ